MPCPWLNFGLLEKAAVMPKELDGIELPVPGEHNIYNALAAALVGSLLGLEGREIVRGLEASRPQKGRLIWRDAGLIQGLASRLSPEL